jgi:hypothetical protein
MDYKPRKMMFKAWNQETKLLMRLNSIDCKKGELVKKDHILLQFTGLADNQQEEIYEMDVLMIGTEKFVVKWDIDRNGWILVKLSDPSQARPFVSSLSATATRLWNYFESEKKT